MKKTRMKKMYKIIKMFLLGIISCNFSTIFLKIKEVGFAEVMRLNSPEWYYILVGCVARYLKFFHLI